MNIDFELYRIFYVVAKNENITKAALELNISQPAISKSIKSLEEQLGGSLFVRTKRGVFLTEEGKEFYKYIKQAISFISSAENRFTELINLETGCIKIGVNTTLAKNVLIPYIEDFHKLFSKIDIQITTDITSELLHQLKNGLIDIVFFNIDDSNYDNDLKIIKWREIHDCFVANNNFSSLFDKELSFKDLNEYPLVLQANGSNTRTFLNNLTKKHDIILKPTMELASYSLVIEFARVGLGIAYVTKEYITPYLENGELKILNIKENIPSRFIGIATSKNHLPNFSTKKLIELITWRTNKKS